MSYGKICNHSAAHSTANLAGKEDESGIGTFGKHEFVNGLKFLHIHVKHTRYKDTQRNVQN